MCGGHSHAEIARRIGDRFNVERCEFIDRPGCAVPVIRLYCNFEARIAQSMAAMGIGAFVPESAPHGSAKGQ